MTKSRAGAVAAAIGLCLLWATSLCTQTQSPVQNQKEQVLMAHAKGTFEVKLVPQTGDDTGGDASLSRMTFDKQLHGDLEGASKGQMLAFGTGAKGTSGAYVAIEKVTGTLHGRSGTFVLQHSATMTRGVPQMTITVVPDSGTGQLAGLAGKFNIIIAEGKHSYEFEYTLPETH
ncbi:MAG TPA: DUF3224 domain-containing protein [Verrucomicrobiae bacterium]|nr:DUF3224 domain-containing protein [Verrucomicrobiae bacterium]